MTDYAKLRVVDLKEILKERELPLTGKKDDLIARLVEHDASLEEMTQEVEELREEASVVSEGEAEDDVSEEEPSPVVEQEPEEEEEASEVQEAETTPEEVAPAPAPVLIQESVDVSMTEIEITAQESPVQTTSVPPSSSSVETTIQPTATMEDIQLAGFTPDAVKISLTQATPAAISHLAETLVRESAKRTRELFNADFGVAFLLKDAGEDANKAQVTHKIRVEYEDVRELPPALAQKQAAARAGAKKAKLATSSSTATEESAMKMIEGIPAKLNADGTTPAAQSQALALRNGIRSSGATANKNLPQSTGMIRRDAAQQLKPVWHAPWKLMRVISGHLGWVRAIEVEPGNEWFCTGAGDRTIKIWDLASGSLRLTLTGHISTVRGLAVSPRHPYLFSCAEDKMVKCWDLESNKVIRHYHGHLSGVYAMALHPHLDILVTSGRDGVARVWDMRTRAAVMVLSGHRGTIASVKTQEVDPQVITGSMDSTVRLWDLAAGKSMAVLTHHKKAIRTLTVHPKEFTFASGSADNIKQWKCPEGAFMQNFEGNKGIVNTLSVNEDDVLFAGSDNGEMGFYDWRSGYKFQGLETTAQPGSLEAEQGIFASTYDKTGLRLITGEADKTIKVWKMDEEATEETHPLEWKPSLLRRRF